MNKLEIGSEEVNFDIVDFEKVEKAKELRREIKKLQSSGSGKDIKKAQILEGKLKTLEERIDKAAHKTKGEKAGFFRRIHKPAKRIRFTSKKRKRR